MQCLYCGKPLGVFRELTDGEFCCRQHRQRYKRLTQIALSRLTAESSHPPRIPEGPAPERVRRTATPPVVLPVAGFRPPAGGVFRSCPPASGEPRPSQHGALAFLSSSAATTEGSAALELSPLIMAAVREAGLWGATFPSPAGEPVFCAERGSVHPLPMAIPPLKPQLDPDPEPAYSTRAQPDQELRSRRPCLTAMPLHLAARSIRAIPIGAGTVEWGAQALGPLPPVTSEAVLVKGLRTAAHIPMASGSPLFSATQDSGMADVPFPPPTLRKPGVATIAPKLVPKAAEPTGELMSEKRLPARPLNAAATPVIGAAALLPALSSLFRYGRAPEGAPAPAQAVRRAEPRNRPAKPIAFAPLPLPPGRLRLYPARALDIVETFEYVRPMEEPAFTWLKSLALYWEKVPGYARVAAAAASLVLFFGVVVPGSTVVNLFGTRWGQIEASLRDRAAVELREDFRSGMADWSGPGDWSRTWRVEKAGYVRPGKLAFFQPSMEMRNYRVEFLVQIERQAVSWAYRARDENNYYAAKIRLKRPGPLPLFSLVRYAVVGGEPGPRVEIPIRVMMHDGVPYRVQISVNGSDYSTAIEGQVVDFWRDDLFESGGFGFFADTGERARVYWMKLTQKEDFVGRVCAYLFPSALDKRRQGRFQ